MNSLLTHERLAFSYQWKILLKDLNQKMTTTNWSMICTCTTLLTPALASGRMLVSNTATVDIQDIDITLTNETSQLAISLLSHLNAMLRKQMMLWQWETLLLQFLSYSISYCSLKSFKLIPSQTHSIRNKCPLHPTSTLSSVTKSKWASQVLNSIIMVFFKKMLCV